MAPTTTGALGERRAKTKFSAKAGNSGIAGAEIPLDGSNRCRQLAHHATIRLGGRGKVGEGIRCLRAEGVDLRKARDKGSETRRSGG